MSPRTLGLLCATGMVLSFGLYTPVAKHWLAGLSPIWCSGLLYLSAGLTLAILLALRMLSGAKLGPERALAWKDVPIMGLGVLCGALASPLLLLGLTRVSGTVGSLLGNLEGVFTLAIAVLLGDSLRRLETAGAALILAGGVALSFNSQGGPATELAGILAVAASCLAWSLDNTTTQRLSHRDPMALMATKCTSAGTLSLVIAFAAGHPPPAREALLPAIVIGSAMWSGSTICFALAMRYLGAARVGSMLALSPFAGAIGSIVGLGERPTLAVGVAGALMALGAYCLARGHVEGASRQTVGAAIS